jgi:ferric-dicitrate binding protein FerR (iron transport regulator)
MDKQYFIQLLQKYFDGDLTKEERDFIESYYNLFQNEPDILDSLDVNKKNQFKNEIKGKVWDKIINTESAGHSKSLGQKKYIWMAAAAIIVLILAMRIFFTYESSPAKELPADIAINHHENRLIFLADGSKVVLSTGSRLNYPSSFDGKSTREVYLQGQAFFDIQHNAKKPFIVHTDNLQTIVLGTAFNIKAMPDDKEITVSVVRGKVKVSDQNKVLGIITPDQEIKYNKQGDNSEMKTVKDHHYLDWKSEDLLLDNVTVAEAAKVLEEEYKVTIDISSPSISSQRFTATFSRSVSLEQALKSICEFNGVQYHYDKKNSFVSIADN